MLRTSAMGTRLKVIRQLEVDHGISVWEPQFPTKVEMDARFYKLVKTVFRKTKRAKPTNAQELIEFYGGLIKVPLFVNSSMFLGGRSN